MALTKERNDYRAWRDPDPAATALPGTVNGWGYTSNVAKEARLALEPLPSTEDLAGKREFRWMLLALLGWSFAGINEAFGEWREGRRRWWLSVPAFAIIGLGSAGGVLGAALLTALFHRRVLRQRPGSTTLATARVLGGLYVAAAARSQLRRWVAGPLMRAEDRTFMYVGVAAMTLMAVALSEGDDATVRATDSESRLLIDPLTGLRTRRALESDVVRQRANGAQFDLAYLDLDGFKQVNDEHGHDAGDRLLAAVGGALRQVTPAAYRLHGDEFVVLVPRVSASTDLDEIRSRLQGLELGGVRASIGVTQDEGGSLDELLQAADESMASAKATAKTAALRVIRDRVERVRTGQLSSADHKRELATLLETDFPQLLALSRRGR